MNPRRRGLLTGLALLMAGCGIQRPPLYQHSGFPSLGIRRIAVLPLVDRRADRQQATDLEAAREGLIRALARKRYDAVAASYPPGTDVERVGEMDDDDVHTLVPAGVDAAMLVAIEERSAGWTMLFIFPSYRSYLRANAKLITREQGIVWADERECSGTSSGLLAAAAAQALEDTAAYGDCMDLQLQTLPKE